MQKDLVIVCVLIAFLFGSICDYFVLSNLQKPLVDTGAAEISSQIKLLQLQYAELDKQIEFAHTSRLNEFLQTYQNLPIYYSGIV